MALRRRRGFTLLEVLIYMFLSIQALALIWALYSMGRSTQSSTTSSYLVTGPSESAIKMLRKDLQQTALGCIDAYPNDLYRNDPPGVSFASPLSDQLQINPYGAPKFDRHVYYTLKFNPGSATGSLVRWEQPMAKVDFLPGLAPFLPKDLKVSPRTVLNNLLAPRGEAKGLGGVGGHVGDEYGGFRVQFLRRRGGPGGLESTVSLNPRLSLAAADNTGLLEMELKVLQQSALGKTDFYTIKLRIHPLY